MIFRGCQLARPVVIGLPLILASMLSAADVPKMFATRVEIPERGEVPGYLFVIGTNKFSFITPTGWKPEGKVDRREVVFISPELDASLILRITDGARTLTPEALRESLAERFPDAKIIYEFNCHAASQSGVAFDLEQQAADKAKVGIRHGVLRLPGGAAELTLRGPVKHMADLHLVFGRFLASFQVEGHRPKG